MRDGRWYVFATAEPNVVVARLTVYMQDVEVDAQTTITSRIDAQNISMPFESQRQLALEGVRNSILATHKDYARLDMSHDSASPNLLEVWLPPDKTKAGGEAPTPEPPILSVSDEQTAAQEITEHV